MADVTAPTGRPAPARAAAARLVTRARPVVAKARAWRLHAAVPGFAGAALVSAAAGLRFGLWAGLLAAGVFALRLDSRL